MFRVFFYTVVFDLVNKNKSSEGVRKDYLTYRRDNVVSPSTLALLSKER